MKNIFLFLLFPFLLSSQSSWNMNLLGSLDYPATQGNDIWGWVDGNNNEYALVGLRSGFSVVNVTNPTSPVEEFFISDINSVWRDVKTWGNYAYVTTEANAGLLIVDLTDMTGNTFSHVSQFSNGNGGSVSFTSAHDIYIDENGIAYIFGAGGPGFQANGAIFLDIAANPTNPIYLGEWNEEYIHDGMVRGDTMWAGCVYDGKVFCVDVSDKTNPQTLGSATTPDAFTHNAWVSDDGDYVFTTDEKPGAYLTAFDVSDLSNIFEVDRIQSNPGSNVIPHNTFVDGNFLITSYYRDGTTVHDITHPNHMVEVAYYDSYSGSGNGFDGCWGTYPFLPSGNIISSEINSGPGGTGQLLIYGRTFQQACYLKGTVVDGITFNPINNASIDILTTSINQATNLIGFYQTASVNSGAFQVVFSATGYASDTLTAVLNNGVMTILDAILFPPCNTFNIVTNNTVQICSGSSYSVGSSTYNISGIYSDTLINYFGCDSIVNTVLTVDPSFNLINTHTICDGDILVVGGSTYSAPGAYTDILTSVNGCDSIVNTNLTVNPIYNTSQSIDICNGDIYVVGQNIYNSSGTYYDTLNSLLMCDSLVITQLNVSNPVGVLSASPPLLNMAANGGAPPYDFQITGPNGFTNIYQNVSSAQALNPPYSGQYSFLVTDANGCESSITTFFVDFPAAIEELSGTKKLLLMTDLLGRIITDNNINDYAVMFFLFPDGTVQKRIRLPQAY